MIALFHITLLLAMAVALISADYPIHKPTCRAMGRKVRSDVIGDITAAMPLVRNIAMAGYIRLGYLIWDRSKIPVQEQDRVDRLLVTFMKGKSSSVEYGKDSGLLSKSRRPSCLDATLTKALDVCPILTKPCACAVNLYTLATFKDNDIAPIFCDPPVIDGIVKDYNGDLEVSSPSEWEGKWVNFTHQFDSHIQPGEVWRDKKGRPSFKILSKLKTLVNPASTPSELTKLALRLRPCRQRER